jgi:4-hydroxybenzoate polyprenyltransferase/phosphoserine phosphatase
VVDLDGTLLNSDMLVESFFALLSEAPISALRALASLRRGKAALKAEIAARVSPEMARMPWNDRVVDMVVAERARGRRVYLASASDQHLVRAIADHLGLFDGIFASDGTTNLSGQAKTAALCAAFGEGGFDYAANDHVDIAVWEKARRVIVVNASGGLVAAVRNRWPDATVISSSHAGLKTYLKAIRVHQWVKNVLLLVPMLSAHRFDLSTLLACCIAIVSFSFCASSVYVMNDLIDLSRDRAHHSKRNRPFAAGTIPILTGLAMVPVLLGASILLALLVDPRFVGVLAIYYVVTVAYSLYLKRQMMIDVVTLACLYGLRLLAGGAATHLSMSAWLAAFSLFLFTGLALVKRCTELAGRIASGSGDPAGRGYRLTDLPMLEMLATASSFTSILVFQLYVNSDAVAALYAHPKWLTAVGAVLVYWLGYVLLLTHRGEMKDDPVVFAATNKTSLCCGVIVAAVFLLSL